MLLIREPTLFDEQAYGKADLVKRNPPYEAERSHRNTALRPIPLPIGSPGGIRTPDPAVNSRLLYRLSYRGKGEIIILRPVV